MIKRGAFLSRFKLTRKLTSLAFNYSHPSLKQNVLGINFQTPIGLAAGFDKNAQLTQILPELGFGFMEVGSITGEPCEGNPKPRLWRFPKEKSILVYYGLKNEGCVAIKKRLENISFKIPLFVSVAKTNCKETVDTQVGIADYKKAYETLEGVGLVMVINISCPNAYGGEPFTNKEKLESLLSALSFTKPTFIKLAANLSTQDVDDILEVGSRFGIAGYICTNLNKKKPTHITLPGGLSGKSVQKESDELIKYVYQKTNGKKVIIGIGGVFNGQDAYTKIRNGASLVQLVTGMIYEGPQVVSSINQELVNLLKKDGFSSISQAIGVDANIQVS